MNSLAVVPIFVNAGAAVLPAVAAGVASALALFLKPRELIGACGRRPGRALGVLVVLGAIFGGVWWGLHRRPEAAPPLRRDWSQLALNIILRREAGGAATRRSEAAPLGLKRLWQYGGGDDQRMFASKPVVAGGRVYCGYLVASFAGYTGGVVCVDANTGREIWVTTQSFGEEIKPVFSSGALSEDGKTLVIGEGLHDSTNCCLLGIDVASGAVRWRAPTTLHIESSPAIRGDVAVVGVGEIEGAGHRRSGDAGYVLAVRVSDGMRLWQHPVIDAESSPTFDSDGMAFAGSGFNGNAVVAMRSEAESALRSKGLSRELWATPCPQPIASGITVVGDVVLAGGGNGDFASAATDPAGVVVALDRRTGRVIWQKEMEGSVLGDLVSANGLVFCPVQSGKVVARRVSDGEVVWSRTLRERAAALAACAVAGNYLYTVSSDGYLFVLDARSGEFVERDVQINGARAGQNWTIGPPVVTGGRVYVGSETGGLQCFVGQKEGR